MRSKKATKGSVTIEASIAVPVFIIAAAIILSYFNIYFLMIKFNRCIHNASQRLIVNYSDYSLFEGIAEDAVKKEILKGRFAQDLLKEMEQKGISQMISDVSLDFKELFRFGENEGFLKCSYNIMGIGFSKSIFLKAIGSGESKDEYHDDVWGLEPMLRGRIIIERFGGNMPSYFELISRFENNEACVIKTINPDASSYLTDGQIIERMLPYIKRLDEYTKNIQGEMILSKKFLMIIPKDSKNPFLGRQIEALRAQSLGFGIEFECIRYGSLYK